MWPAEEWLAFVLVAKAEGGPALAVLDGEKQFRVKRCWHQPRQAGTGAAQPVFSQEAPIDQRLIDKIPRMRMRWIETAELGEELTGLDLHVPGQRHGFQVRLLRLD